MQSVLIGTNAAKYTPLEAQDQAKTPKSPKFPKSPKSTILVTISALAIILGLMHLTTTPQTTQTLQKTLPTTPIHKSAKRPTHAFFGFGSKKKKPPTTIQIVLFTLTDAGNFQEHFAAPTDLGFVNVPGKSIENAKVVTTPSGKHYLEIVASSDAVINEWRSNADMRVCYKGGAFNGATGCFFTDYVCAKKIDFTVSRSDIVRGKLVLLNLVVDPDDNCAASGTVNRLMTHSQVSHH